MILLTSLPNSQVQDAMYYKDFRTFAKRYNNLFHYGFGLSSLKSKSFWASILCLAGMAFFAYATVQKTLAAYIPLWASYAAMIAFELSFGAAYFLHVAKQLLKKQKFEGAYIPEIDASRDELDVRKDWLARHFPIPREQFLGFVVAVENVENHLDSARHKKKSAFEAYVANAFKWTKPLKWAAITIGPPISVFIIQAFLERKDWTANIQPSLTAQNFQAIAVIGGGLLVAGAVIAFVVSMSKYLYWYCLDVISDHGCSQPSVDRLMKDLLQLSMLEVDQKVGKPPL